MVDVRREPARPVARTASQRLRDVRALHHRRRLDALLRAMRGVLL
jgi:hypothetical protein